MPSALGDGGESRFCGLLLEVALLFVAEDRGAVTLRRLLQEERGAALGAGAEDGTVSRSPTSISRAERCARAPWPPSVWARQTPSIQAEPIE